MDVIFRFDSARPLAAVGRISVALPFYRSGLASALKRQPLHLRICDKDII